MRHFCGHYAVEIPGTAWLDGTVVVMSPQAGKAGAALELTIGARSVRLSSPNKVVFPELGSTKLQLVEYYQAVGDGILRALRDRPCMIVRYPDGIGADPVYQKRLPKTAPDWVEAAQVTFPSERKADELKVTELASIIWAVQMSTIEFHPWPVRRDPDCPDELRLDLDPQPGTDFADARHAAHLAHELLDELGYVGWLKTSGGRGVHITVPLEPTHDFVTVRRAGLAFARELERRAPTLVTTAWWKEERGERVFVDFNQNARDRMLVSAYSVRATPHAPVSTPLRWSELDDVAPEDFTIVTVPDRFAELGDVHAARDDTAASLAPLLEWVQRDERDHGLGDAPYPPNYPKMPGEPLRVQPSRAKAAKDHDAE